MPLEELIERILSSRPGLTREEVLRMIDEKEKSAKGFLTRESAARAVAGELGVEPSKPTFKGDTSIADLVSGLNDVTVVGRVILVRPLQKFAYSDETEGKVRRLFMADMTGVLKVALWDEKADTPDVENLTDQIVRFSHGYMRRGFDGGLELNIGLRGDLKPAPANVSEDEFPHLSSFIKKIGEISAKDRTANVIGIVGRIYPVSTFQRDDGSEGKVGRLELEDASGRITVVLWNNRVDEMAEIATGRCLEIFGAKVRESPDGYLELHVDYSSDIAILKKEPTSLGDLLRLSSSSFTSSNGQ